MEEAHPAGHREVGGVGADGEDLDAGGFRLVRHGSKTFVAVPSAPTPPETN
jgi:hypothetical protein